MKYYFLIFFTLILLLLIQLVYIFLRKQEQFQQRDRIIQHNVQWANGSYSIITYDSEDHLVTKTHTYGEFSRTDWNGCHMAGRQTFPHWGCYGSDGTEPKIYLYNADDKTIISGKGALAEQMCYGCKDQTALNYDPICYENNTVCQYLSGCTNPQAINYNPAAKVDDGSCEFKSVRLQYEGKWPQGCEDPGQIIQDQGADDVALQCQQLDTCCGFTYDINTKTAILMENCINPCPYYFYSYSSSIYYYTEYILKPANCIQKTAELIPVSCLQTGQHFKNSNISEISTNCLTSSNCCGFVYSLDTFEGWYDIQCAPSANCTPTWLPDLDSNYYECYQY